MTASHIEKRGAVFLPVRPEMVEEKPDGHGWPARPFAPGPTRAELTVYLRTATHIQPRNHIDWGDEYGWHNRHGLCPYLEERRFLMLFEKSFTKNFLLV
ncbi:hypothetical protein [Komagataeibacter kakiaceti]